MGLRVPVQEDEIEIMMKEDVVVTTGELGEGVVQGVLLDKLGEDHHPGCGHLGIDLQEEDQDLQEIGHQEVDHLPEEGQDHQEGGVLPEEYYQGNPQEDGLAHQSHGLPEVDHQKLDKDHLDDQDHGVVPGQGLWVDHVQDQGQMTERRTVEAQHLQWIMGNTKNQTFL